MLLNHAVKKWTWSLAGLAIIASVAGAWVAQTASPSTPVEPSNPALTVKTITIHHQDHYEMRRVFSGQVAARRVSDLGFDAGGLLVNVAVDVGDVVKKGQWVAQLDSQRLEARRAELNAALDQAKADMSLATATLKRLTAVVKAGGVSHQELDVARERKRAAIAALALAQRRIESVDVEQQKRKLHAPFTGTVVARFVDEGRVMNAGEPVLRLQEQTQPEIRIGVAGTLVNQLKVGRDYSLQWQNQTLTARLRAVLPLRENTTRTVEAIFDPIDHHQTLRSGDLVNLDLTTTVPEPGAWLPLSALTEGKRGLWSVYVSEPAHGAPQGLDATHRLVRRSVDLIYQETDRVFVRAALDVEDRIVASGLRRIVPGQWVRLASDLIAQSESGHE